MLLLILPACAGIGLAVVGAAASGAQFGAAVYSKGRLTAAVNAPYDMARRAILSAADDLDLAVQESEPRKSDIRYTLREPDKSIVAVVYVDERTPSLTMIRVDVGRFGSEAVARLIAKRASTHLAEALDEESGGDEIFSSEE